MQYRLGSFHNSAMLTRALARRRVRFVQQVREGDIPDPKALPPWFDPDLLNALSQDDPDREWVELAASVLSELRDEGHQLRLVNCAHTPGTDGYCSIMVYDRSAGDDVRDGDVVYAGVAISRTHATGLCVMPRIFREVCCNGAVIEAGGFDVEHVETYQLEGQVRAALDRDGFRSALRQLQSAARTVLHDPLVAARRVVLATPLAEVLVEWVAQSDYTVYGLLNAATAAARGEAHPILRLERERDAGRILRALLKNDPNATRLAASHAAGHADAE